MGKSITIKHKGKSYVLELSREVVKLLEKKGVTLENVINMPVNTIPELFAGAFYSNHKNVSRELVDEIYESLKDKQKLTATLCQMYDETVNTLFAESEDGDEGNATWELN